MKIVCMSDIHSTMRQMSPKFVIPDGDLLIIAGDLTSKGRPEQISAFGQWLREQPHRHKVYIAGNHDFGFQESLGPSLVLMGGVESSQRRSPIYLQDGEVTIEGLRIWGAPWQPWFYDWAFNLERGAEIREKWDLIPDGIDILVTHGPPADILDLCPDGARVGCADLMAAVRRVKPKLHVFGHIHHSAGLQRITWEDGRRTTFVNAATCTEEYRPLNPPIVIDTDTW